MNRDRLIALLILLLLAVLAAIGCVVYRAQMARVLGAIGLGRVSAGAWPGSLGERPIDLALRYEWHASTMPPPYHYEYTIVVGPGLEGAITLYPDYPGEGVPEWREAFAATDAELDYLYGLMVEARALGGRWVEAADRPVGGEVDWLEVTADGETTRIPALVKGREALEPVYGAIRALVPAETWERLRARRQAYEDGYAG